MNIPSVSGRAFPDVAAQGENFQVIIDGSVELVAGTSCSSPVRMIIVFVDFALLSDHRIADFCGRDFPLERLSHRERQTSSWIPEPIYLLDRTVRFP